MKSLYRFLLATAIVASITGLIYGLGLSNSAASVSLLYLLGVTVSALACGRAASIYAAVAAFLTFDYFFTQPKHTLSVQDPAEWIALSTFLITALVIGQLIQSRDELMRAEARAAALADADKIKTALLSMISHDFRSPLTSIKAFVSTLLSEDGTPMSADEQRSLYQGIEMEADRLNRMVGNVLDLSRLEANAWKPRREWIPVSEITGMSLSNFSVADNERIKVEIAPTVDELFVDSTQISSVIKNLVENALKYSPKDKAVLLRIYSAAPNTVALTVSDEGRGLPESVEEVFKPFWRAPELQESNIPGVGIGLAVCRGLVEAHGGKLTAEQRKPCGACFTVLLPRNANETEVVLSGESSSN
jgi:two-component system sensor histidine kinase KdpD